MEINKKKQGIRVRFAPSPTGVLHVGGARTALFNFLFTKKHGGKMILRIEDTDKERSKKEYEKDIFEGLRWLSISHDELYHQSERTTIYKKYLEQLIGAGAAYISKENNSEEGKRGEVIRFKNPGKMITFHDLVRGDISFDTTELGDFVIAKDLETPLYHLAVVADDIDMGITHIIRGEDGISNTPRQILIQEALGAPRPLYAHIPFILAPDRSKLSKRHGAVSMTEYRNLGFLPEAMVNFLAFIGWNPGDEQEIFSMEELVKEFSLEKVQKGGAIFNVEKLRWMNGEYMKKLPANRFQELSRPYIPPEVYELPHFSEAGLTRVVSLMSGRASTFSEIRDIMNPTEIKPYFETPDYQKEKLLWKEEKDFDRTKKHLEYSLNVIKNIPENEFTAEGIKNALWDYATKEGRGAVLWPLRFALLGKEKSPDPFALIEIIAQIRGKEEVIKRINRAIELCND